MVVLHNNTLEIKKRLCGGKTIASNKFFFFYGFPHPHLYRAVINGVVQLRGDIFVENCCRWRSVIPIICISGRGTRGAGIRGLTSRQRIWRIKLSWDSTFFYSRDVGQCRRRVVHLLTACYKRSPLYRARMTAQLISRKLALRYCYLISSRKKLIFASIKCALLILNVHF